MISFCQDLSISYEYHIYQNQTIKKTIHKRNGSYISQRTITKTPKLEVISKDISHYEHHNKGIQLTSSLNKSSSYLLNSARNKDLTNSLRFCQEGIKSNTHFAKPRSSSIFQVDSIQIHKDQGCLPIQFMNNNKNKKVCNFFKDQNKHPKITWNKNVSTINNNVNSINKLTNAYEVKQTNSFFNSINNDSNDILNSPSHFKSSISTKFCNSRSNSHNADFNQKTIQIKPFSINSTLKRQSLQQNITMNDFKRLVINPETIHPLDKTFKDNLQNGIRNFSKSVLYDVKSIQSKQLKTQSNESVSIVQQRNFFFSNKQFSKQFNQKSISNFIISDEGVASETKNWKFYKQAQQISTKKYFSIKQFTQANQALYMTQYQNYLLLNNTKSQNFEEQDSKKCVLQLVEVISNDKQKFYLIKEPFEQTLSQYLIKFTQKNERSSIKAIKMLRNKIQSEIKQIFNYLNSKNLTIKDHENLQLQDFVICKSKHSFQLIKFHNLLKLQQIKPIHNKYDLTQSIHSFKKKQTDNFVQIGSFGFIEQKKSPKKLKTQENQTIQTNQCQQIKIDILCMKIDKLLNV